MTLTVSKQLRLHFDVNKTIIATDAAQGHTIKEMIKNILAETISAPWDGNKVQSYYEYVTQRIARQNPELKETDKIFKENRNKALGTLAQDLTLYPSLYEEYQRDKKAMKAILNAQEMVIFPSFFKLIAWLEEHFPHQYALYLRTFGTDLPKVVPLIENTTDLLFTGCGVFNQRELSLLPDDMTLFDFFNSAPLQHYAIQDDYEYWKLHGFDNAAAKIFPVDTSNGEAIALFFDDNANDAARPIVYPVDSDGKALNRKELIEQGYIVPVNPKLAILDENYFINKVQKMILLGQQTEPLSRE